MPYEISLYVLPTQKIDSAATKVHGLSVSYATGQKLWWIKFASPFLLLAYRKQSKKFHSVCIKSNNEQLLLVGHTFDQNRLLNFIHETSGSEYLEETSVFFGDSLPAFRNKCRSLKLVYIYKFIFPDDTYKAHDALADG